MKRNQDDRLIQLAFDEAEVTDATESVADPRLVEYRSIRQGLNLLKEVPEDQFSKERLRNAILTRGLSTSRPPQRTGFSLATMAAAACALAFGYVTFSRMNAPGPVLVEDPAGASIVAFDPDLAMPMAENEPETTKVAQSTEPEAPVVIDRPVSSRPVRSVRRQERSTNPSPVRVATKSAPVRNSESDRSVVLNAAATDNAAGMSVEEPITVASTSAPEAPIVLIEPTPDASGTRATERETFTNVLVGG